LIQGCEDLHTYLTHQGHTSSFASFFLVNIVHHGALLMLWTIDLEPLWIMYYLIVLQPELVEPFQEGLWSKVIMKVTLNW